MISTLIGFVQGTVLGILLAVGIVHVRSLDRSLMPWLITSQTIPILAIAPMVIVVLGAIGITGLFPKALISTYLSFFPVAVGMVKGLRSPETMHIDLMHTYKASAAQTFWEAEVPASVPYLFASMKVAVAASLVGAIVANCLPARSPGLSAKLLSSAYYSQSIDIWATLVAGLIGCGASGRDGRSCRPYRRPPDGREAGMTRLKPSWQALAAVAFCVAALC